MFNQPSQPEWLPFQEQFGTYLTHYDCPLQDVTAEEIHDQILKMADEKAAAADGQRVHEIKQLPLGILQPAAELYRDIEHGQPWPLINCFAWISCLPKTDLDVLNPTLEPGIFVPSAYDTRLISNISPWATLCSGLRFKEMAAWREMWLPASMHGARCKHETNDVSYELQMLMEYPRITHEHVAGIALDRKNFFGLFSTQKFFQYFALLGSF